MIASGRVPSTIVTRGSDTAYELPGRAEIEGAARRFHRQLSASERQDRRQQAATAAELQRMLLAPVAEKLGIDLVWFGVMVGMNLQTSFLTPPFGFALFYLRGVTPDDIRTSDIYKGVAPFIAIQILGLALLFLFPGLVTWLLD